MLFEIKHHWNAKVLFSLETDSLKLCLEAAVKTGADLTGAYLTGAELKGADLRGAYLTGAYLRGAYLTGADLRGADLRGAYLTGAYLTGADLTGAYLRGAYLTGAYLKGAYLTGAYMTGAELKGAYLKGAYLTGADGEPIKHATPDEAVANLDKVREIILDNEERLNMSKWHDGDGWVDRTCAEEAVCGTTHCLAGWLQVCSTDKNIRALDTHLAGIVSAPVAAKMFFRDAPEVLEWLREKKYADEANEHA